MCFNSDLADGEQIRGWLEASAKNTIDKDGAICTNYVVIAEYVDGNGEWYSLLLKDNSIPSWRTEGLVNHVMAQDSDAYVFEPDDDDEEDY